MAALQPHILKVDDLRFPGLIGAEAHCLHLARAIGLTSIDAQLVDIGGEQRLIVSRFDRKIEGSRIERIHQEDACQALGIDPEGNRGRAKYERAGGPSLRQIAQLLDQYGSNPNHELGMLVRAVTFTALIGNADAHGKNLALLHPDAETVTLAPLYDTVPTLLWPKLRTDAAMTIGGHSSLLRVTAEDIAREANTWGYSAVQATELAQSTIHDAEAAIADRVIPGDSPVAKLVLERACLLPTGSG